VTNPGGNPSTDREDVTPKVRGRTIGPVYGAGFVTAFGAHAVAANLGSYGAGHHTSLLELGFLLGVYDGAEVLLKPVFGWLADRVGAKPVMLGGLVAFALASLAFVGANDPGLLGLTRFAQGAAAAAFSPAAGAMVAILGGTKRRGRAFGGYGGAKSLGYLLGPLVGGLLVAGGGYPLLFGCLAGIAVAVSVAVAFLVPHVAPLPRPRSTIVDLGRRVVHPTFLNPVLILAAGTAALSTAVGFFPVLGSRHHLGPIVTGALVSLVAATVTLIQPWAGRAIDKGRLTSNSAVVAIGAMAIGFVVAAASPTPVGIAGAGILVGVGIGISTPIGFARLAASAPSGRMGQTMGAGEVGRELGDAGGPILVGVLGPIGLGAGLVTLAGALGLSAVGSWLLGRREHGSSPEPD
jgi:DHA1 family tetracycline resistance protein-like MFS transporter